eukprot:scaffold979_cov382-Prasinococcus_capsulatus_cf.AAC.2
MEVLLPAAAYVQERANPALSRATALAHAAADARAPCVPQIGFAYMNAHISKAQIHSNTAEVLMDSEKSSNPLTGLHTAAGLTLT